MVTGGRRTCSRCGAAAMAGLFKGGGRASGFWVVAAARSLARRAIVRMTVTGSRRPCGLCEADVVVGTVNGGRRPR